MLSIDGHHAGTTFAPGAVLRVGPLLVQPPAGWTSVGEPAVSGIAPMQVEFGVDDLLCTVRVGPFGHDARGLLDAIVGTSAAGCARSIRTAEGLSGYLQPFHDMFDEGLAATLVDDRPHSERPAVEIVLLGPPAAVAEATTVIRRMVERIRTA